MWSHFKSPPLMRCPEMPPGAAALFGGGGAASNSGKSGGKGLEGRDGGARGCAASLMGNGDGSG